MSAVIVVGAGPGVSGSLARLYAAEGWSVGLVGNDEAALADLAASLHGVRVERRVAREHKTHERRIVLVVGRAFVVRRSVQIPCVYLLGCRQRPRQHAAPPAEALEAAEQKP